MLVLPLPLQLLPPLLLGPRLWLLPWAWVWL